VETLESQKLSQMAGNFSRLRTGNALVTIGDQVEEAVDLQRRTSSWGMYKKINKIHLIGIGGIGMSGVAELLLRNGYRISGSDLNRPDHLLQLENRGVSIYTGHAAENITGAELVVYSSAIRPDNPEMIAATELQIPAIPRAEMLAELMRLKHGIAVAGAHGKTTTTSMIGTVLIEAGVDPTVVVGGRVDNFGGTNARLGSGEFMVVEAD
jgi:UDP-N-acetylmuramate--alanine ligase